MRLAALAVPLAILLVAGGCQAEPSQESVACNGVPQILMQGRVTDAADILSEDEEARLSDRLAKYEQQTKHQMVVATIPSLNGARVDNFGTCLGNRWAIGRADQDDGVLILVAPQEQQMRIATGTGMEKMLTDDNALAVVQQITPRFKRGDYVGGLRIGIDAIAAQTGEAK